MLPEMAQQAKSDKVRVPQLTVATVITEAANPVEQLAMRGIGIREHRVTSWGGLLRAEMNRRPYVIGLWRGSDNVFHFFGSPPVTSPRWKRVEQSWISRVAPTMSRVLLNQDDFSAIGDLLAEHGSIEVNRMTARVVADGSSYSRGWPEHELGRRPSHRDALSEIAPGRMTIGSISMHVGDRMYVHLRRQAGATLYSGSLALFCSTVLARLTALAKDRLSVLSGVSRSAKRPILEAVQMSFELDSSAVKAKLLDGLGKSHGVRATMLYNDSYLHFILTDHLNGSNFDLILTEDYRLRLVPGFKATPSSMARVLDAIGESLGMLSLSREDIPEFLDESELFAS